MGFFTRHKEEKPQPKAEPDVPMEDVKRVLMMTDRLLGHLPPEEIEQFTHSEEFTLYKQVLHKLVPEVELQPEETSHITPEHVSEIEQIIDLRIKEYFERAGIKPGAQAASVQPHIQAPQQAPAQPMIQPQAPAMQQPVQAPIIQQPMVQPAPQVQQPLPPPVQPKPVQAPQPVAPVAAPSPAPQPAAMPVSSQPARPAIDMAKIKASIEAKLRGAA